MEPIEDNESQDHFVRRSQRDPSLSMLSRTEVKHLFEKILG
jgi:hypothetical protein